MTKDEVERALEAWKITIQVQQHFNDIEMKIRNYALTLLVAILAGAGVAIREGSDIEALWLKVPLASVVLGVGFIGWMAFYFMDVAWYHRLLLGAVEHALDLEKSLEPHVTGIGLSTRIKDTSPIRFERLSAALRHLGYRKGRAPLMLHSTTKIHGFYLLIGLLVLLFAVLV